MKCFAFQRIIYPYKWEFNIVHYELQNIKECFLIAKFIMCINIDKENESLNFLNYIMRCELEKFTTRIEVLPGCSYLSSFLH